VEIRTVKLIEYGSVGCVELRVTAEHHPTLATYSTSGTTEPSLRGGVASTTVWHPAMRAGTDSISAVDGSTAVPEGRARETATFPAQPDCSLIVYQCTRTHSPQQSRMHREHLVSRVM